MELSICTDCYFRGRRQGVLMNGWDTVLPQYVLMWKCDICRSHLGGDRQDVVWTTFEMPQRETA